MDKVCKLSLSISAGGESYPCEEIWFEAKLNDVIRFSAVVSGKKGSGANMTTVGNIRDLAAKLQKQMFTNPKDGQFTINASGCGKALNVKGLISSVELMADTGGGLKLQITGTSSDSLMDMYNGSVYVQDISAEVLQRLLNDKTSSGKVYTLYKSKPSGDIANRLKILLSNAHSAWQSIYPQNSWISGAQKIVQSVDNINKQIYKEVITPFLANVKAEVYGGKVDLDDENNSRIINDGLHQYLFESGTSFLSALLNGVCKDFAFWYVPLQDKSWKSGTLIPQKYGDDKIDGEIDIGVSSISFSSGSRIGGRAPCAGVGVLATLPAAQLSGVATDSNADKFYTFYPEKAKRKFGTIYTFQAPPWITIPASENEKLLNKSMFQKAQESQPYINGRQIGASLKTIEKQQKNAKKAVDKVKTILDYLAEKWYYRALLEDSNMTIEGPYTGAISSNIGDQVSVKAMNGGTICTGVLASVSYRLSASGGGRTVVNITLVKLPKVKIE